MSHPLGMLGAMDVRRRLNCIAASQHSLVTLDQALKAGLSIGRIRRRVRTGEWLVVRPRVYAVAGAPVTWIQTVAATALSLQPRAWLSHSTAGRLWGFPEPEADKIDVLVDFERRVMLAGVHCHRSRALFTADLTRHLRIPVTSPERTLVDLSATVPERALGRMLDDGLRRRVIRLDRLRCFAARLSKSPGCRPTVIQGLLAARLPGYDPGDSDLETRVLRVLVAAHLPAPVQQHWVRVGGQTFKIDLAYPEHKLAVELDGWEFHKARTAFDGDRARANLLVASGWTLVRFTSRSSASEVADCVHAVLRQSGRSDVA